MTVPLTLAGWSLGSGRPFPERVAAAAAAGFTGVGLRCEDYLAARAAGFADADLRAVLAEYGVAVTEVEFLNGWGCDADRDAAQREREATILHMARAFGVRHVNAGMLERLPPAVLAPALAALCDRAGGLSVALEFMPYGGVPTLPDAARLLERCGHPGAGLLVDAWHWARTHVTAATLREALAHIDVDRIISVQLCDTAPAPRPTGRRDPVEMRHESLHHRRVPGAGCGDVAGMLRTLDAAGAQPWLVSVEVMDERLWARGSGVAASTAYAAARQVLHRSRAFARTVPDLVPTA